MKLNIEIIIIIAALLSFFSLIIETIAGYDGTYSTLAILFVILLIVGRECYKKINEDNYK